MLLHVFCGQIAFKFIPDFLTIPLLHGPLLISFHTSIIHTCAQALLAARICPVALAYDAANRTLFVARYGHCRMVLLSLDANGVLTPHATQPLLTTAGSAPNSIAFDAATGMLFAASGMCGSDDARAKDQPSSIVNDISNHCACSTTTTHTNFSVS